ncbi:MAG: hypothetical protein IJ324_05250 [Lachnospiraceae bacterium]|nr:hypothetical protein [Lachnospiraceae bacterium]
MNAEDKFSAYQMLFDILNDKEEDNTEDDKTFRKNTKEQITDRDKKYTELLSHFVWITKIRNVLKEIFKWSFYLVVIGSILVLIVVVYKLFNRYISSANMEQLLESTPLLITAMVGFVSTIITIPVTITKYLFSTEEDKNITEIILHTQEHDTSGRQWAMEFMKMADGLEERKGEGTKTVKQDEEEVVKTEETLNSQ